MQNYEDVSFLKNVCHNILCILAFILSCHNRFFLKTILRNCVRASHLTELWMSMYISYGAIVCRYKTANPDIFYHTTMYIFTRSFYKVVKNCKVEEQKKRFFFFRIFWICGYYCNPFLCLHEFIYCILMYINLLKLLSENWLKTLKVDWNLKCFKSEMPTSVSVDWEKIHPAQ